MKLVCFLMSAYNSLKWKVKNIRFIKRWGNYYKARHKHNRAEYDCYNTKRFHSVPTFNDTIREASCPWGSGQKNTHRYMPAIWQRPCGIVFILVPFFSFVIIRSNANLSGFQGYPCLKFRNFSWKFTSDTTVILLPLFWQIKISNVLALIEPYCLTRTCEHAWLLRNPNAQFLIFEKKS